MVKEDVWGKQPSWPSFRKKKFLVKPLSAADPYNSTVSFRAAGDCEILFLSFDKVLHSCTKACQFHHRLIDNMVIQIAMKNMQLMGK
jgi:hypothetical protein